MGDTLDLELRLGLGSRDSSPRSNGAAAEGARRVDLLLSTDARKGAGCGEAVSDRGETEQPTSAAKDVLQVPQKEEDEEEEEAAAAEPGSKRSKTEPPASPPAARKKAEQEDGGATEPAWVRAELLSRHALPPELPLHFVQEKVLTESDLKSDQSRLLIWSGGSDRLRPLLSAGELTHCGLDSTHRRRTKSPAQGQEVDGAKKKRDDKTRYPGVPVLVYERAAERAPAALRLNSFLSTKAMVINGHGYGSFVAGSGFKKGDRVEVWAFRRPNDQHLCFVVAKRDDDRLAAINPQE
ncbi:hypothetical protein GQ55_9G056000 [Panicum hallii var. hallii]|uniref:TF-B3 domain-containing protein n=1 Tax=Panicum hallii var. hallii TaxID=1504633 RepID=A0A2T7BZY8_9POAL|nr:hypothetical protein GQ55_9G056000 [Panicum hallii var. hallii]